MHKRKCILPIVYPPINGYPHQGALFSILFARDECKPWIFNNFVQTFSVRDMYKDPIRSGTIDFYYNNYGDWKYFELKANPWIRTQAISVDIFEKYHINFINFIKDSIENNKYLFFAIDRYYIPAYTKAYHRKHIDHELLIYGYDDKKKVFYMSDNTDGKYNQTTVTYKELKYSFFSILNLYKKNADKYYYSEKTILLLEVKMNSEVNSKSEIYIKETYDINIYKIANDIKDYLLIENHSDQFNHSDYYVYGIDCYKELEKISDHQEYLCDFYDFRAFYSFLQHKKLMILRLQYLNERYPLVNIINEYEKIRISFENAISLIIKYNLQIEVGVKNVQIPLLVKEIIKNCKLIEYEILKELLSLINKNM